MTTNEEKHAEAYLAVVKEVRALDPARLAVRAGGRWEPARPEAGDAERERPGAAEPEEAAPARPDRRETAGPAPQAGTLTLPALDSALSLVWPELEFRSGNPHLASFPFRLMALHYLSLVSGEEPGEDWVSYREIPDGMFYAETVSREVERPLAEVYGSDPEAFLEAGAALGGEPLTLADAAFALRPFPKVPVVFTLHGEDEEFPADFPAEVKVLYERSGARNLPLQDLRILAEHLGRMLRSGGGGGER